MDVDRLPGYSRFAGCLQLPAPHSVLPVLVASRFTSRGLHGRCVPHPSDSIKSIVTQFDL